MVSLDQIVTKVRSYNPVAHTDLIEKAFSFSELKHRGQLRKSGDPYFIHPVHVANIIAEMKLDTASVCAGLLHDVVEDTATSETDIQSMFGDEVSFLVSGVTKLGKLNFACKEDQQAENFRKMLLAMSSDIRVILVKLADRLDNMRTLEFMKPEAQERIARETMDIYAPLAGRLGIQWLKAELEDLSFCYLKPQSFLELTDKTNAVAQDRERYVAHTAKSLEQMLIERGFAANVSGRQKHLYSLYRKMRQAECEFEQVQDFVAFRVVMENVADCYAALGVVHSQWTPIPGRFKDYIALPKPNKYQSLHTTVVGPERRTIEVQIRTKDMHQAAEFGIAAHWTYKEAGRAFSEEDMAKFAWLRQLVEMQKDILDPVEFMEGVKFDLFLDEVFVFTPKGDVKVFPTGSTPVDFAYAVHTQVGNQCRGARVNGAIVPLRYKLNNGDIVEIITHPQQEPSKDWLEFVVSSRARSKIRAFLRQEGRKRSMKLGRDLLEKEIQKRGLSFARTQKSKQFASVFEHFKVGNEEELYSLIGYGKLAVDEVCEIICPPDDRSTQKLLRPSFLERTVQRVRKQEGDDSIMVDGVDNIFVRFAKCCNPVPGDTISGWITRGRGVTIHRRDCPKILELDTQRRVSVSWAKDAKAQASASIRVTAVDRPGILASLTNIFKEHGVNINSALCRSPSDGVSETLFEVTIDNLSRLRTIMRSIGHVDGVYDVERL